MNLTINGEQKTFPDAITVSELIERIGLKGKFVAVERNREIVSFRVFERTTLQEGDVLEIVTLVGGG